MKATGIVRRVDNLGRIVIPKEVRKIKGWEVGTPLEIYTDEETVIMKKYKPGCYHCGDTAGTKEVMGTRYCKECADRITLKFEE